MLKTVVSIATLFAAGLVASAPASAAPLSFSESTTASGSLDGTSFSDALITLSGMGDTSDITNPSFGIYTLVGIPVEVTVVGVGSDDFTDQLQLVSNQDASDVGVGDNANDHAILFANVDNSGYDLSTSFGPVFGSPLINSGFQFATSGGVFEIDSTASVATYQATVSAAPEPSTWALMIAGMGVMGAALRFGRRRGEPVATAA